MEAVKENGAFGYSCCEQKFYFGSVKDSGSTRFVNVESDVITDDIEENMAMFGSLKLIPLTPELRESGVSGDGVIDMSRVPIGLYAEKPEARDNYPLAQRLSDISKIKALQLENHVCDRDDACHLIDSLISKDVIPTYDLEYLTEQLKMNKDITVYFVKGYHLMQTLFGESVNAAMTNMQQQQLRYLINLFVELNPSGKFAFSEDSKWLLIELFNKNAIDMTEQMESVVKRDVKRQNDISLGKLTRP